MTYLSTILADSPTHFWRCADPGGVIWHDVGSTPLHMQNGASADFLTPYSGPASDGGSGSFLLNLAANYYPSAVTVTTPYTLECWFWAMKGGFAQGFFAMLDPTTGGELGLDAANKPHAYTLGNPIVGGVAAALQAWHHLVLTQSAGTATLYFDGTSVGSVAGAAYNGTPSFQMGAGGYPATPTRQANAFVAECAVYPGALTASRVSTHFAAADNAGAAPVYGAAGTLAGGIGGGVAPPYQSTLDLILKSVRKVY